MKMVQAILISNTYPRAYVSKKIGSISIGFSPASKVRIYCNEAMLFVTREKTEMNGYELLKKGTVTPSGQLQLPKEWSDKFMKSDNRLVVMDYREDGMYIFPFNEKDFKKYVY